MNRDQLMDFVTNSGVSHADAETAVNNCFTAIVKRGIVAGSAGTVIGFFATGRPNPVGGMVGGVAGIVGGAASAPFISPQCSEVREAASAWLKNL